MIIEHEPIANQICSLNRDRLTLNTFKNIYKQIDFTKPTFLCLTNYNDVAPLFMWLGLELVDQVNNYNSSRTNYLYRGMLNKNRVEQIIEDGDKDDFLSQDYVKQFQVNLHKFYLS